MTRSQVINRNLAEAMHDGELFNELARMEAHRAEREVMTRENANYLHALRGEMARREAVHGAYQRAPTHRSNR